MVFDEDTGSDRPRFQLKFTRPMIILLGGFLGLIAIIVVVILVVWPLVSRGGQQTVAATTPLPTTTVPVVTDVPSPPTAVEATSLPESTAVPEPTVPPATQVVAEVRPTAAPTEIPIPSRTVAAGAVATVVPAPTTVSRGAGETAMPEASSGVPWLIPVGVLLLVAVLWWRWRRAHSTN